MDGECEAMNLTKSTIAGAILLAAGLMAACVNKKDLSGKAINNGSLNTLEKPKPAEADSSAEKGVDPPANILGSYLQCTQVNVPFDADNASTIGCALYDEKTAVRVDMKTIASNIDWQYELSSIAAEAIIDIYIAENMPSLDYDVHYSFSGFPGTFADLLSAFIIKMNVTDPYGNFQSYRNSTFMQKPAGTGSGVSTNEAPGDIIGGGLGS